MGAQTKLKAAAVLTTIIYCSLLAYQSRVSYDFQKSRPGTVQVLLTNDIESVKPKNEVSIVNSEKTVLPSNFTLDDIFISVKTTKFYQDTRLPIILKTWFQLAKNQTWFFTDTDNSLHQNLTNGHMVNTKCSATHERTALCCKMSVEYDTFIDSLKKWFCHFDDDNYVNVPQLFNMLKKYNPQEDWYFGKTSVMTPLKVQSLKKGLWFATGGAGFCMSRSVALKITAFTSGGRFISTCEKIRLPDDVTVGFVIKRFGKTKLTYVPEFHSHLEQLNALRLDTLKDQISFSYKKEKEWNVVNVPGFSSWYDPTRFLSLHCFLFPHYEFCPR